MRNNTESHSHTSSRAALLATLTKIVIVLFQLSLAVALFDDAQESFERHSVPCIASGSIRAGIPIFLSPHGAAWL